MPAGLLLSPTARTVRSGPFEEGPVGAVPFSVMRRPSSGLQLRRFPLIPAPEPPYPAPIPGKVVGAKARPQDTPSPPGSRYGFPPLPGETRILSCPLSREYRSRCLPAPPVASDPPPVFPLPDLLRSGASVPLLPGQKIVRSTSIFPAIPAPLCKEK